VSIRASTFHKDSFSPTHSSTRDPLFTDAPRSSPQGKLILILCSWTRRASCFDPEIRSWHLSPSGLLLYPVRIGLPTYFLVQRVFFAGRTLIPEREGSFQTHFHLPRLSDTSLPSRCSFSSLPLSDRIPVDPPPLLPPEEKTPFPGSRILKSIVPTSFCFSGCGLEYILPFFFFLYFPF